MLHFKKRKKGVIGYFLSQFGFIIYKKDDPYSWSLPGKVEVGDKAFYPIPYQEDCILKTKPKKIGISDVFGRYHWVSKKDTKEMLKQYKKDFGSSVA